MIELSVASATVSVALLLLTGPALAEIRDVPVARPVATPVVAIEAAAVHPFRDDFMFVATVNGGVSSVPVQDLQKLVVLQQCQPNPFNPRTMIKYSMARAGRVSLVVHDLSGEIVRVLLNGEMVDPGEHEVIWSGVDKAGREVSSGVYFYRIEALGESETKRMTLVQ